ncbi:glycoside hydrolase family 35 protein [Gracilibacillus phocaeensis]|uniref:glycoside hydrolase family 35 protein n=1 Tax=Gracilibacillus phocaeensis TaxID=2042304 RepID=UPI0010301DF1|nr:beta-galactosidase [Gracilibacillus phocaeensis]
MTNLTTNQAQFIYQDKPITIVSGAIHYFRVVPEYWQDRLAKLKACGFNSVETYIPWNLHEPQEGQFYFEGMADLTAFIELAEKQGLFVILRPTPYICAEWEFGGLPSWLLADRNMRLRSSFQPFLEKVDAYFDRLLPLLKPYLSTNGGPVIAMQIENEYGSFGNDTAYLEYLRDSMRTRGMDVLLFTSDGAEDSMLQGGMIPDVLETVNFGSNPVGSFTKLREYQRHQPVMCMEFWNGWFDHWGEEHHTRDAKEVADVLDGILQEDGSVNFYMFHGGTNFGFYNGANLFDTYEPTITSYDSDAPLNEAGEPTEKFYQIRNVLERHFELPGLVLPEPISKQDYGEIRLAEQASLFANLKNISKAILSKHPNTMEQIGQDYGFILYQTFIPGPRESGDLTLQEVHDRALVFADGVLLDVVERWDPKGVPLTIPEQGLELAILVENMGRVNYGPHLWDEKGITEGIRIGNQFLYDWTIYPLSLTDLTGLAYDTGADEQSPAFYRGNFHVKEAADTFVSLEGWTKGVVFINGFNLGRYWHKGPQQTLYLPGPLLREGENEIIIFELHRRESDKISLRDTPALG